MANCKECYHYEVCRMHYQQKCELTYETEKEVRRAMLEAEKGSPICDHFKDRSRFVELPCKVGDAVYKICPVEEGEECNNCPWEYCECYDIGFIKDRHNSIRKGMIHNLVWLIKRMPYFGKIYFTNYENAEKALKERENNAE